MKKIAYLLVNFGGPRTLKEVEPFLQSLLTDQDVVRTGMPAILHRWIFNRVAKKRAKKISHQYEEIGGGSPIFEDTQWLADALGKRLRSKVLTFHRYLTATHENSLNLLSQIDADEVVVFPLFPQFTYATTGSIARLFYERLPPVVWSKFRWIKSYPSHPAFIRLTQERIFTFLKEHNLKESEVVLLFSAHGIPKKFVLQGDLYEDECRLSYHKVMEAFPDAIGILSFQSKFGPGEWLKPYTVEVCEKIESWNENRDHVVFIPITFTSDHIETLFEVEKEYLPIIANQGLMPYRLPAFNRSEAWVETVEEILKDENLVNTPMLVRWY